MVFRLPPVLKHFAAASALALVLGAVALPATAQVTAFKQAVAENVADHEGLNDFYRARIFEPVWTGEGELDRQRRAFLLDAMRRAPAHGIPASRHNADALYARCATPARPAIGGRRDCAVQGLSQACP